MAKRRRSRKAKCKRYGWNKHHTKCLKHPRKRRSRRSRR